MILFVCVYVWLWRVSIFAHRLSPVAVTGGCSLLWGTGFSLQRSLWCQHRGFSSFNTWSQELQPPGLEHWLGSCGSQD